MIRTRHHQPSLWTGVLAEEWDDLWEPWMRTADRLLDDEQLIERVFEAQARRVLTPGDPDKNATLGCAVWLHCLAIIYSPLYLAEHASSIRADWPRIPLPADLAALECSAALGERAARLLDVEKPALGVTTGKLRKELSIRGA